MVTLAIEPFALDLLVLIASAGLVALILGRLKIALIPGYLVAGVLVGPVLGIIDDPQRVGDLGSLAVILLMFTIGLHLDFRAFRASVGPMVVVGLGSTLTGALVIAGLSGVFGLRWQGCLVVGMALAMSSTAAVLKMLMQRREIHRPHGRLGVGVLLIQDLLVVAGLSILPMLGSQGGDLTDLSGQALVQVLVVGLMIVVGRFGLTRLIEAAVRVGGSELVLVIGAGAALGAAVLTSIVGLSAELGAFVAGLILAGSPVRHQLSGQLVPLRDLFMAMFFTVVGVRLAPGAIGSSWWVLVVTVPGLMILKSVLIGAWSWAGGASPAVSLRTGLILGQGGEFSLIVLMAAEPLGVLDSKAEAMIVATVFASLLLTPALFGISGCVGNLGSVAGLAPWVRRSAFAERPAHTVDADERRPTCEVIVAGFGPVGRACVERLEQAQLPYTIIELNARTVAKQTHMGRSIVYGDATNPMVLESAGVEDARALILTIPDEDAMLRACRVARQANADLFIAARAAVLSRAMQAKELGADLVVVDEIAAALAMSNEVVRAIQDAERKPEPRTGS